MTRRLTEHLTTYQLAKIAEVAPRTVAKWIDSGLLPGFRLPAGEGRSDRRVTRQSVAAFLRGIGHPAAESVLGGLTLLACGLSLEAPPGWRSVAAECPAAAGALFASHLPAATVIDVGAWGVAVALPLAAWLLARSPAPRVLLVATEDAEPAELELRCPGVLAVAAPLTAEALADWLGVQSWRAKR